MNCLKNYIQIAGCNAPSYEVEGETTPEASSLFINQDLPISLEEIDKIADSEQVTFLGVWNEVQDRALRKFVIEVKAGYKELFAVCGLSDDWFCENKELLAMPLLYFLGAELMFEKMFSNRINRYTTIDKVKATELRKEFLKEFTNQLKNALELIRGSQCGEAGAVFKYIESLP